MHTRAMTTATSARRPLRGLLALGVAGSPKSRSVPGSVEATSTASVGVASVSAPGCGSEPEQDASDTARAVERTTVRHMATSWHADVPADLSSRRGARRTSA